MNFCIKRYRRREVEWLVCLLLINSLHVALASNDGKVKESLSYTNSLLERLVLATEFIGKTTKNSSVVIKSARNADVLFSQRLREVEEDVQDLRDTSLSILSFVSGLQHNYIEMKAEVDKFLTEIKDVKQLASEMRQQQGQWPLPKQIYEANRGDMALLKANVTSLQSALRDMEMDMSALRNGSFDALAPDVIEEEITELKYAVLSLNESVGKLQKNLAFVNTSTTEFSTPTREFNCTAPFEWVGNDCLQVITYERERWDYTRSECRWKGGDLAVFTEISDPLNQRLKGEGKLKFWVGVSDNERERSWYWVNGNILTAPMVAPGEPNGSRDQNCGALTRLHHYNHYNGYKVSSERCTDKLPFICQLTKEL